MLPLQHYDLVERARRADLLASAQRERLARSVDQRDPWPHVLRDAIMRVLCLLPAPALEPACAMRSAR